MMRNGFRFTREVAEHGAAATLLNVVECTSAEVPHAIQDAHVVVPLMSKVDAAVLSKARQLKLILQYGVGLEGVDIDAVRPHKKCAKTVMHDPATRCWGAACMSGVLWV